MHAVPEGPEVTPWELRGWWLYDFGSFSYSNVTIVFLLPLLIANQASNAAGGEGGRVSLGGVRVKPADVALYFVFISVAFQIVSFVSLGAIADFGSNRKRFLVGLTITCVLLNWAFVFVAKDSLWWLSGTLLVLTNITFGCCSIFYNAFLPLLITSHPRMVAKRRENCDKEELRLEAESVGNLLSNKGYVYGFVGGILMLFICVGVILAIDGLGGDDEVEPFPLPTFSLRLCCGLCATWWLLSALFTFRFLHTREGLPKPENVSLWTIGYQTNRKRRGGDTHTKKDMCGEREEREGKRRGSEK